MLNGISVHLKCFFVSFNSKIYEYKTSLDLNVLLGIFDRHYLCSWGGGWKTVDLIASISLKMLLNEFLNWPFCSRSFPDIPKLY